MAKWQLLALLLGLLLVTAPLVRAADEYEDDGEEEPAEGGEDDEKDVVVLTTSNFDAKIQEAKFALVEFYAPWCGHCQKLKPEYAKAATALKEHDPSIVIGKVDATKEESLGKKYEVSGYPTLKWFVDGKVAMDYSGGRDADGIIRWVKKKTGPIAVALLSEAELTKAEKENEVIVLAYFDKLEGDDYETFAKFAQKTEDAALFETTSADVAKAAGLDKAPGFAVITNFADEKRVVAALKDELSEESLTALVNSEKLPLTIEFNDGNSQKIFGAGIEKQLLLVASASDLAKDSPVYKAFRAAGTSHRGKLVFVTVNTDGESKGPVVSFFGIKDEETPVLLGFDMSSSKKFKLTEDITEESVAQFADDFLAGKLTAVLKSAPIPEEPTEGGVTIVVGKNFEDIVKDPSKDVLLEVYAPWCGHCKQLEPIYRKLAKRFSKVDSVVIAKMDGTENEHPDVDVKGFPTILFYPAGEDSEPITFDGGDRSLKALTKFVKKNAKVEFELPKKKKDADEDDVKDEL